VFVSGVVEMVLGQHNATLAAAATSPQAPHGSRGATPIVSIC